MKTDRKTRQKTEISGAGAISDRLLRNIAVNTVAAEVIAKALSLPEALKV